MKNANKPGSELTKREYIATQIMAAIISNSEAEPEDLSDMIAGAIQATDALLKALEE